MKIVAGLGNPGAKYAGTPHNAGFEVLDRVADRAGGAWKNSLRLRARLARVEIAESGPVLLLKPRTYMNLSGASVAAACRYYSCDLTDLTLVFDDADLAPGRIRIRKSGGAGGHRGMRSVIESVGGEGFPRVRVGVGRVSGTDLKTHVLGQMTSRQREEMAAAFDAAADAVECLLREGPDSAMNRFNSLEIDKQGG